MAICRTAYAPDHVDHVLYDPVPKKGAERYRKSYVLNNLRSNKRSQQLRSTWGCLICLSVGLVRFNSFRNCVFCFFLSLFSPQRGARWAGVIL